MSDSDNTKKNNPGYPATDDAWKEFGLINDWIRHADNKVGVTFAASAAVGVMLYNLVRALPRHVSWCTYVAPTLCGVLLVLAVSFCTFALNPQVEVKDSVGNPRTLTAPNHLYFGSISTWRREQYVEEFVELSADSEAFLREIASQVHVNAKIATTKMKNTKCAVYALSGAVVSLAFTAIVVTVNV